MTLLLNNSKAIQYEAFGLLELIVSCPKRSGVTTQILKKNKENLINFIMNFQIERGTRSNGLIEDFDFQKDKKLLVSELKSL